MKIAIPVSGGELSPHFAHAESFALFHVNPDTKEVEEVETVESPGHTPGLLPRWLNEQGIHVVIAGGMGQRARDLFSENGIEVVIGAAGGPAENIVSTYLKGELRAGANPCDHRPGENCDHHHHGD